MNIYNSSKIFKKKIPKEKKKKERMKELPLINNENPVIKKEKKIEKNCKY